MIRQFDLGDGVAGIALACEGSVNVLSKTLNATLAEVAAGLLANESVVAIVITSDKADFAAGGDLSELLNVQSPAEVATIVSPFLQLLRTLETSGKPVVAAMPGSALGGGLELALACHHRIAADQPDARFGLPEVTLGLMPGGGGTQRLPRLIGLEAAAPLLFEGKRLNIAQALRLGIIDEQVPIADLQAAAKHWALANPKPTQPWDRKGFEIPGFAVQSQAGRQFFMASWAHISRSTGGDPAKFAILQALQQGLQRGLEAGVLIESRQFFNLAAGRAAKNRIRTLFTGVNHARSMKARPAEVPLGKMHRLAVVGGGVMGRGIAFAAAQAGVEVYLKDVDEAAARQAHEKIREYAVREAEKGRLRQPLEGLLQKVVPVKDYESLRRVDFVIEAVFEQPALKQCVLRDVAAVVGPNVPIASNTSTLPIAGLADAIKHAERVIGLHFFSPVDRMPLVEVVQAECTNSTTLAHALDLLKLLKKTPVVVHDGLGFFTSRIVTTYSSETLNLIAEGTPPPWIDNVAVAAGFVIGGASLVELTTLPLLKDILVSMRGDGQRIANAGGQAEPTVERLLALGRVGKVAGGGLYDYGPEGKRVWPGLAEAFPANAPPDPQRIQQRLFFVQSLEAVRCLDDGILQRPLDGDVAAVLGWGYPARLGGPFAYIDGIGLENFVNTCDHLAERFGGRFTPPQRLRDMARAGTTFYE